MLSLVLLPPGFMETNSNSGEIQGNKRGANGRPECDLKPLPESQSYMWKYWKSTVRYKHWHREGTWKGILEMTRQPQKAFVLEGEES